MVRLWRISNYADLTGVGGLRFSARWHSKGRPILYAAEHPAGAMTEMLVHLDRNAMPDTFQLIEIELEDAVAVDGVPIENLAGSWASDLSVTRAIGDAWLASGASLALRVPSVILPDAWNVLLNPARPDAARMKIAHMQHVPLDARLK